MRSRLIERDRLGRYLIYAAGEIALIVIGILLALQMDALNERRGDAARERDALGLIREDLRRDVAELDRFVETRIDVTVPYLEAVYNKQWDGLPLDSLPLTGTPYFNFQPFNSAYQGLKSGGTLSLIQSDSLRNDIIWYYERDYINLHDWSSWHKNFVTNTLEPFMFNELVVGPDELVRDLGHLEEQLSGRRLNSLLATQIGSMTRLNEQIQSTRARAMEIVAHIDQALAGSD